jgi:hypothetical protein
MKKICHRQRSYVGYSFDLSTAGDLLTIQCLDVVEQLRQTSGILTRFTRKNSLRWKKSFGKACPDCFLRNLVDELLPTVQVPYVKVAAGPLRVQVLSNKTIEFSGLHGMMIPISIFIVEALETNSTIMVTKFRRQVFQSRQKRFKRFPIILPTICRIRMNWLSDFDIGRRIDR